MTCSAVHGSDITLQALPDELLGAVLAAAGRDAGCGVAPMITSTGSAGTSRSSAAASPSPAAAHLVDALLPPCPVPPSAAGRL